MAIEKTILEKIDKILLRHEQYMNKTENLIIATPQLEDYEGVKQFNYLDNVLITDGFYKNIEGIIVSERDEIPVCLDYNGNKTERVVIKYGVAVKSHEGDRDITVVVDVNDISLMNK